MRDCEFRKKAASGFLAVFFFGGFLCAEGWAQLTPLHVGHASVNSRMSPLWVAAKEGFFKKQGFDVRVVNIRGGTQTTQALLGGGLERVAGLYGVRPSVEFVQIATLVENTRA
jgi:ABC-type nitrate/sulfonate/bicarbonate transport system substrate-binding protein